MTSLHNLRRRIHEAGLPACVEETLSKNFWKAYFIILNIRIKFRHFKSRGEIETAKLSVIYIDPKMIKWVSQHPDRRPGIKYESFGSVEDGDWDLKRRSFEDEDIFIALKEHFFQGIPLSKTKHYARTLKLSEEGKKVRYCRTKDEYETWLRSIDELFNDIKNSGYKSQKELGSPNLLDEITVYVDRNGEFLLEDGIHRLSIAKILGITEIPVMITKRHRQWVGFKNKIWRYHKDSPGAVYQPLIYPDLKDIPSAKGDERWDLISKNLPFYEGSMLDIGANWGYFCHKFEDLGFTCCAVENSPRELYLLEKLKRIDNKKFTIIPKSIFEIEGKRYDIVLALNVFHHFLKNKQDYDKLTRFLTDLDTKIMFFEPHQPNEPQMQNAYINYNETDFINYILVNSCLNKYMPLGKLQDGRNVYLLSSQ